MSWAWLLHRVAVAGFEGGYRRYLRALESPESAQRGRLREILGSLEATEQVCRLGLDRDSTYEEFARRAPVVDYADIADRIQAQRLDPQRAVIAPVPAQFLHTSGSTTARKWVPSTPALGRELDAAAAAWIADLARRTPGLLDGRHYWSLSWLPDELRGEGLSTDDLDMLPPIRRWALRRTMAVPGPVAHLAHSAASRRATLVFLAACHDLRLVSVWSPTFLTGLLDAFDRERDAVAAILERGRWEAGWDPSFGPPPRGPAPRDLRAAREIRAATSPVRAETWRRLWPSLRLVSAWDSSTSAPFARQLRARLPHARFQGKGLWATEGVVSIPFAGHHPAAVTSHLLEFRCLQSGRVQPVWELEVDQEVQPVLTTGGGLLRYALADRVQVTGRLGHTPCLRFLGRLQGVDLVGEKMDSALADAALRGLEDATGLAAISLLAVNPRGGAPRYVLLAEPGSCAAPAATIAGQLEECLRRIHHYAVARDLGQLAPGAVIVRPDALALYENLQARRTRVAGGAKIEPVLAVEEDLDNDLLAETAVTAPEMIAARGGER